MENRTENLTALPSFTAPERGRLTPEMLAAYEDAGVIIVEDFVGVDDCDALRQRALQLVEAFDPAEVQSVFSTTEQTQLSDKYYSFLSILCN